MAPQCNPGAYHRATDQTSSYSQTLHWNVGEGDINDKEVYLKKLKMLEEFARGFYINILLANKPTLITHSPVDNIHCGCN